MKSLECILIQYDQCPYKNSKCHLRTQRCREKAMTDLQPVTLEDRREASKIPLEPSKQHDSVNTLILDFSLLKGESINPCCFSNHPVCGSWLQQHQEMGAILNLKFLPFSFISHIQSRLSFVLSCKFPKPSSSFHSYTITLVQAFIISLSECYMLFFSFHNLVPL